MEKLKVVKIGGKLIEEKAKFREFLKDFSTLEGPKILVHGGGKMATEIAGKLGYETKMVEGRRITDENSINVITMVYGGLISKNIVAQLQVLGKQAIGLSGADGFSIVSKKRPVGEIDYGFVGDIERVHSEFIGNLLQQQIIPVFCAISCSEEGLLLNTNADSIAAAIAESMSDQYATELYFSFEKKGVLANAEDDESVITEIDTQKYKQLLENKIISDGMLPKLHNCFEALKNGVSEIYLGDFRLLKEDAEFTKIKI